LRHGDSPFFTLQTNGEAANRQAPDKKFERADRLANIGALSIASAVFPDNKKNARPFGV
jgi:hypothetical protein